MLQVLVTKLTSTTTRTAAENQQYRKLAKALLVLFPLLGITYVLTISVPTDGSPVVFFIRSIRDALISTQVSAGPQILAILRIFVLEISLTYPRVNRSSFLQGFIVSIFYCFFNMEVRTALRHNFRIFCEKRRIGTKRQRLSSTKEAAGCENVR